MGTSCAGSGPQRQTASCACPEEWLNAACAPGYSMAYLFCRCTRSVSQPPPTYYAHLAAFRGRIMLQGDGGSSDAESIASGATATEVREGRTFLSWVSTYIWQMGASRLSVSCKAETVGERVDVLLYCTAGAGGVCQDSPRAGKQVRAFPCKTLEHLAMLPCLTHGDTAQDVLCVRGDCPREGCRGYHLRASQACLCL